jgi:toxin secretion/phage lysis holin
MEKHGRNRRFVFGFMSVGEFITSLLGFKTPVANAIGSILGGVVSISSFIYMPYQAVILLAILMLVDFLTGVWKASKLKTFNSFTMQRMFINFTCTMFIIAVSSHLVVYLPVFGWFNIDSILLGGFCATYFISIIENLYVIDKRIVPKKMMQWLQRILDLDNMIPYFKAKKIIDIDENISTNITDNMDSDSTDKL